MPQWTVRLPEELAQGVRQAAEVRGFSSPRAFVREALRNELAGRKDASQDTEERLAATLERITRELRRLGTAQQAQFALTDALAKVVLVCLPEPPGEAIQQARSRAKLRYDKFLKTVASAMAGDARAALAELVNHAQ